MADLVKMETWEFVCHKRSSGFSKEAMICAHGGYKSKWGMAKFGFPIDFYDKHLKEMTFIDIGLVITRNGAMNQIIPEVKSSLSNNSPCWNYNLQPFTKNEYSSIKSSWKNRMKDDDLEDWDWWTVDPELGRKYLTDMKKLSQSMQHALGRSGATYSKVHFLACREWFSSSPPKAIGQLTA